MPFKNLSIRRPDPSAEEEEREAAARPSTPAPARGSNYPIFRGNSIDIRPARDFFEAAASGDVRRLEKMLSEGQDVDALDEVGRTALHWAAENGQDLAVTRLRRGGASMLLPDGAGRYAVHLAAKGGRPKALQRLLSALPDIVAADACNAQDAEGLTPVFLAGACGGEGGERCREALLLRGARYSSGAARAVAQAVPGAKRIGSAWLRRARYRVNAVSSPSCRRAGAGAGALAQRRATAVF